MAPYGAMGIGMPQPIDRRAFAEGDTSWHLPCYLHIQAHAVNTGVRQRSISC